MVRRAMLVALLALSVLLAGCNGGGQVTTAPGEDTPTDTPTATPGAFAGAEPPAGVGTDGVSDLDALMEAHSDALDGTPVTVGVNFHLTVNGSGQNSSFRAKVLPGERRGWLRATFQDGVGTYYTADGTTYFREVVDGQVEYGTTTQVSAVPEERRFGVDEQVRTAVGAAEWEPVGTVQRDGETLFEFRATSVDPPDVNTTGDTTVRSDGRLLVDGDGVVRFVSVSTTVENDRGTVRYGLEVTVEDVGTTTVAEPDWLENAE